MIRIALDLELEQPRTNSQTPDSLLESEKIIQVGYVIFDDETGEQLKEVCREVNIGVPLSQFIKQLTGITDEQISNGTTLEDIIDELHNDRFNFNASRKLITWGGGDQDCIVKEISSSYPWKFGRSAVNAKHLFQLWCEVNGKNPSGGLKKSMGKMGLMFDGSAHNALVDAINTAKIFMALKDKMREK